MRADGDVFPLKNGVNRQMVVDGKPEELGDERARYPRQVKQSGEGDPQVEPNTLVFYVVKIVAELGLNGLKARIGGLENLRQAAQSGPYQQAIGVLDKAAFELSSDLWPLGTRPDQAHLAAHHIEQLR